MARKRKTAVVVSSDEYGSEEFIYDSEEEALEGLGSLAANALKHFQKDEVERSFRILPLSYWKTIRQESEVL